MDVPGLQEWFSGYIQTLFSTGYLNRSQFKPFYVVSMATYGFTSEPISFFIDNALTTVQIMVLAMAAPVPNFPTVVEFAQHLGASATRLRNCYSARVGALRTANLTRFLRVFAEVEHKQGCLVYLHMLSTEIEALDFCFSVITELETAISILGLAIPFDW